MPGLGEFMVTSTGGWVAWVIRKLTRSSVNHAAVYIGKGFIVEAQPAGARVCRASNYPNAIWSSQPAITIHQRLVIVDKALAQVGKPYSFLDIAALGVSKILGNKVPAFIAKRLSRPDRLICSQLVDEVYHEAGIELFTDGRPASDVTPADLYDLIKKESR